jgi:hypothetical protein
LLFFERSRKCGFFFGYRKFCSGKNFCNKILNQAVFYGIIGMKIISFPFWENIVNNGEQVEGDFFMKAKRISAWIIAVSLCITNSGLVYAAENTGMEESTIQAVQEEDSIKEKKDEEPAAECVSEDVQAEISNENELSGEITTETENVPENGTQEQHDWEAKLYLDGTAEITKYTGSDKDVVIPSTIEGHTVTSLEQEVFYKNTTVETIHIPATVIHMGHPGDVVITTFDGTKSLRSITVEEGNPVYFSRDGVLFRYAADNGKPMIERYPENKPGETYIIPRDIDAVGDFYQPKNLRKIVIPDTVSFIGISAFTGLSDATIVFCHTEPSQVDVRDIFASLTNCKIIVKNQAMKEAIGSADDFYNSENTSVLLESELSAEERNAYLTPATDLTFADGSRTKNITLEPEENCTIDYQLFPEDTTDVVTWKSSDDKVAYVETINGHSTLKAVNHGQCTLVGTDGRGRTLTIKAVVSVPIKDIQCMVHYEQFTNNGIAVLDYHTVKHDFSFNAEGEHRVYFSIWSNAPESYGKDTPTCNELLNWNITGDTDKLVYGVEHESNSCGEKWDEHYFKVNGAGSVTINVSVKDDDGSIKNGKFTVKVLKSSICNSVVSVNNVNYNGKAQMPEAKVILKDKELKKGTDYTISYSDNTKPGTGKAIIKGTGNYTGETVAYFEIQKKDSTTDSGEKDQKTDQKKDNTTEKSGQKITGISSSYKKAYNSSFTLKPKAKGKITYKSSNTKVATVNSKGKVKIKGTGKVTISITAKETSAYKKQTKKVTIYAVPGKRDIKKLSSGKKKLTVQWKKDNRSDGYQVQYSTDKKFKKNVKNVVIGKKQTTKQTIKKLKTGKKYYVRIRSYKKISGKKYYGTWSSKKTVKVK